MKKFPKRLLILLFIMGIAIFLDRKYLIPNGILTSPPSLEMGIQAYGKTSPIEIGKGRLLIHSKTGIEFLDVKEFVMASTLSGEKGLEIITNSNELRAGQASLTQLEEALKKLGVPIYRLNSYVLNLNNISRIEREDISRNYNSPNYKYSIILESEHTIPLPKDRYKSFMEIVKGHFQIDSESEISPQFDVPGSGFSD